jgi:hypothetical protein
MRKTIMTAQAVARRPESGTMPAVTWTPPPAATVQDWVLRLSERGDALLTMSGPNPTMRAEAFRLCYTVPGLTVLGNGLRGHEQDWVTKGIRTDLTQRVRGLTPTPWGLIWDLLSVEDFVVEDPLKGLIDQGFRFTGCFKALWEARFLHREKRPKETMQLLGALIRWMTAAELTPEHKALLTGVGVKHALSETECMDMLLFVLALAYQNGLTDRSVFVFDGIEQAKKNVLRKIADGVAVFERWTRLGSAAGIVLGLNPENIDAITAMNPRLGKKIVASLV